MSQPLNNNTDQKNLIYNINRNTELQQRAQSVNILCIALLAYSAVCDITSCTQCSNIDSEDYKRHGETDKASCSIKCSASFTLLMLVFSCAIQGLGSFCMGRDLRNRQIDQRYGV